jgi:hypothetical protein
MDIHCGTQWSCAIKLKLFSARAKGKFLSSVARAGCGLAKSCVSHGKDVAKVGVRRL